MLAVVLVSTNLKATAHYIGISRATSLLRSLSARDPGSPSRPSPTEPVLDLLRDRHGQTVHRRPIEKPGLSKRIALVRHLSGGCYSRTDNVPRTTAVATARTTVHACGG